MRVKGAAVQRPSVTDPSTRLTKPQLLELASYLYGRYEKLKKQQQKVIMKMDAKHDKNDK